MVLARKVCLRDKWWQSFDANKNNWIEMVSSKLTTDQTFFFSTTNKTGIKNITVGWNSILSSSSVSYRIFFTRHRPVVSNYWYIIIIVIITVLETRRCCWRSETIYTLVCNRISFKGSFTKDDSIPRRRLS